MTAPGDSSGACQAMTKRGTRCTGHPVHGLDVCLHHATKAQKRAIGMRVGREPLIRAVEAASPDKTTPAAARSPSPYSNTTPDVLTVYRVAMATVAQLRSRKLEPAAGQAVASALRVALQVARDQAPSEPAQLSDLDRRALHLVAKGGEP